MEKKVEGKKLYFLFCYIENLFTQLKTPVTCHHYLDMASRRRQHEDDDSDSDDGMNNKNLHMSHQGVIEDVLL
mgnify:CR=1 FL=1